jgi:sialate O-acetylesterase
MGDESPKLFSFAPIWQINTEDQLMIKTKYTLLAVLGLFLSSVGFADTPQLPPVFSDHMVLQRDQPVPVWGTATPGTTIAVEFGGQNKSTTTDAEGKWSVDLDSLSASAESRTLTVSAGDDSVKFDDVLVGEVWLCGGQSNMDFTLQGLSSSPRDEKFEPISAYLREEIATAADPLFRHFKVARAVSPFVEQSRTPGQWQKAITGEVGNFTATGYFFGRELRKELEVPVALLSCNWGGTRVEAWIPKIGFQKSETLQAFYSQEIESLKQKMAGWNEAKVKSNFDKAIAAWKSQVEKAKADGTRPPNRPGMQQPPEASNKVPATLFNGMTFSLIPYAIKGVVWYQGESNAHPDSAEEYQARFSALIESWREVWGQDKLYFGWCQLANFKEVNDQPLDVDHWATVCDQQRRTLALPDTGMAVLNDIGQSDDIHPKNKIDVGKRLALWAFKQAYGQDLVYSGPLFKSFDVQGNQVIVTFDQVGSGLMVGEKNLLEPANEVDQPLRRFQICGSDGKWKWADAKIVGKDTVVVSHADIPNPVEVRYAWSANPAGANLYNKEGLPASVFRTSELLK